ncbi:hypothetical protein ACFQ9X_04170 [Catenulispora yoronensis]
MTVMLLTGFGFSVLILAIWGSGVLVVRSRRRELQAAPGAQLTAELAGTAAEVHSIEEFIARAEALPEDSSPGRAPNRSGTATRSGWSIWPSTTSRTSPSRTRMCTWSGSPAWRSGCWPGSRTTPACPTRSTPWTS